MAEIPECPRGREEEYLADIAGLTDNAPKTPWSRKEAYLQAIDDKVEDIEEEIEELKNNPDVADIVATYADLEAYDTSKLTDKDIIRVLADETHDGASTYYRWSASAQTFTYIGEVGDYYTKTQTNTLLADKQDKLTAGTNISINDETDTISCSISNFTGTDGTTAGAAGLVPAPAVADAGKFLKADGTWATAGGSGVIELTEADKNYPTNNPDRIRLDLLDFGLYRVRPTANNTVAVYVGNLNWGAASNDVPCFALVEKCYNESGYPIINKTILGMWDGGNIYTWGVKTNGSVEESSVAAGKLLKQSSIVNNLSSSSTVLPLSANQGYILNGKIEGRIITNAGTPTTSTVGTVGQLLEDTTNGKLYQCTAIDNTDPQNPSYTWTEVGAGGGGDDWFEVKQDPTTHYITTTYDELEAAIDAGKILYVKDAPVFNGFNNIRTGLAIRAGTDKMYGPSYNSGQLFFISVNRGGYETHADMLALTYYPKTRTISQQFGVAAFNAGGGIYIDTATRGENLLLQGRDVLTVTGSRNSLNTTSKTNLVSAINEVNTNLNARVIQNAGTPTTATVGTVGKLLEDTTNGKVYICTAVTPGVDPDPTTYTWVEVGAGGGGVQTLTTDDYNYPTNNPTQVALWMLPQGFYKVADGVKYGWQSGQSNTGGGASVIVSDDFSHSSGTKRKSILVVPKNEPLFYSFVDWSSGQSVSTLSGYSGNTILNKSNINSIISPSGSSNAYVVPSTSALLTWTGLLSNLTTTDKTDLVSAINEVKGEIGNIATALHAINNGGES